MRIVRYRKERSWVAWMIIAILAFVIFKLRRRLEHVLWQEANR